MNKAKLCVHDLHSRDAPAKSPPHDITMEPMSPSRFYDELKGAQCFVVRFPVNHDGVGPRWTSTGDLIADSCELLEEEAIEAVALGGHRYRLAEKCLGPLSLLTLYWGDEFLAERSGRGTLILTKVVVPRRFRHYRFITGSRAMRGGFLEAAVHQVNGGWEIVARGRVTITLPAAALQTFHALLEEAGLPSSDFQAQDSE